MEFILSFLPFIQCWNIKDIIMLILVLVFVQALAVSVLMYGSTTWTLAKRFEKKLDGNCTMMLCPVLKKFWKQHSTKQLLYSHLPPILATIEVRQERHGGHCLRRKKRYSLTESNTWTHQYWSTNKNLHSSALYRHWMPLSELDKPWWGRWWSVLNLGEWDCN